jgi:hypothetical protein
MLLPADPATPPDPTTAAGKSIHAERNAQRRAYPIPIDEPDSPRYKFRTLRLNPVNAKLNDVQFNKAYGLVPGTSVRILGPQSGERNAGVQGITKEIRNSILDKGGPDIGFNPKRYMDLRRKNLMLILDAAAAPDPRTVAEAADKAPSIDNKRAYLVPIGGPGSPRHEFRTLRQNDENALLKNVEFEKKYSLPRGTTLQILGPKSGERNAGVQGVSKEARNSIRDNGGPDIGFTPSGYLERRRKALIAAAAAEVPRAETAGDGPAKRPRLDTGLHNEPSMSDPFMPYQDSFAGQYRHDEAGTSHFFMPYQDPFAGQYRHDEPGTSHSFMPYQPSPVEPIVYPPYRTESGTVPLRPFNLVENPDTRLVSPPSPESRALPSFGERPGAGDRPAAAPQGGGHRSPSPDPQMDTLLQSFNEY